MRDVDSSAVSTREHAEGSPVRWRVSARPLAPLAPPQPLERRRWWIWAIAALWVFALVFLAYRALSAQRSYAGAGLGLSVERNGGDLVMTWDAHAPAVQEATKGVLSIVDGNYKKDIDLDPDQLQHGRILYSPDTSDVFLELELLTARHGRVSESVRVLGDERQSPKLLATNQSGYQLPPEPSSRRPARNKGSEDSPKPEPRQAARHRFVPDFPASPVRAASRPRLEPPKTEIPLQTMPASALLKSQPVLPPPSQPVLQRSAAQQAPVQPVSPAPTTQAPVSRPAPQSPPQNAAVKPAAPASSAAGSTYGYVGPKPIREIAPAVPQTMRPFITHDVDIEVIVSIDATGKVERVKGLSTSSTYLSQLAASTVNLWRFEPARMNGRNVPSEMKLVFRFRAGGK